MSVRSLPAATIAILLPYAERFSATSAGAISLCVSDSTRLSRFGDRIEVYGKPVAQPYPGITFRPVEPVGRWLRGRNRGLAEGFWRQIRGSNPALIEVHNRPQVFLHLARRSPALRLALHLHNDPTEMDRSRTPEQRRDILRHAAAVYCVSRYVRDRFLDGLDGQPDNLHVLYNGIERRWSKPPDKEKLILFVGRMIPEKGALEFVAAMEEVLPRHPDWKAVIVGARRPGRSAHGDDYETAVYERFRRIGPAAEFLGFQPHDAVMELYARAAIAVVPSVWPEPFGRTAVEALAAGCALVTTDRGGLPEIAQGRGVILDEPSAPALAGALEHLITDDAARAGLQRRAWEDFPFHLEDQVRRQDELREAALSTLVRPASLQGIAAI